MLSAFVLCVLASVTKAGKMISELLELFSLCVSVVVLVVVVVVGVVLIALLSTNAGTRGGVVLVCSALLGNCTPIS